MVQIDDSKEYGLVLEGGGAKGAYQIGAFGALRESGIKIKGVSGTSVGALNGALICMDNYEKAKNLWESISYSKVMDIDDKLMEQLMKFQIKDVTRDALIKQVPKVIGDLGLDITPLEQLIAQEVDEEKIRRSGIEFLMTTINITDRKIEEVELSDIPVGHLKDYLLASAFLPAFKSKKLLGKTFLDAGIINNVPIDLLLKRGYKDIIIIRIFGVGHERAIKIPEDVNITIIQPHIKLGGILQFESWKSRRNLKLGYYDALRATKGLIGRRYYLETSRKEAEYTAIFVNLPQELIDTIHEVFADKNNLPTNRYLMESALPLIAQRLKLPKNWTYQMLYIQLLELAARYLHIPKFQIYTEHKLEEEIRKRFSTMEPICQLSKDTLELLAIYVICKNELTV